MPSFSAIWFRERVVGRLPWGQVTVLTPGDAGLPNYGGERRRVAGLRRDEIAVLAGVSPQYYVRLERGDATGVSTSVIDSIARAPCSSTKPNTHCAELARGRTTRPR
jgi:hypothetical protein